ncbi:MAG: hypothetical protein ISN28_04855 [Ectothiorhodospiraceae bacterium AqS1]|nr:hypothetical protein [Ectothiorhodospiraceae bacterium AqS1]
MDELLGRNHRVGAGPRDASKIDRVLIVFTAVTVITVRAGGLALKEAVKACDARPAGGHPWHTWR